MAIKDELLFDFAINMPRVLVSGNTVILDNVKKLVLLSRDQIIVHNGQRFTSVVGKDLTIKELKDERMLITGDLEQLQFYGTLQKNKD
ncbi:YabP/YqfC family sporulation protein [Anaerovorax odorimutans]|uniref:YabP/YqfC family sporulation protein n=1 Tax=Anaerovorax odorimutans TaxID=109327 RepID=A0ABT1RMB2_9FIRM|nr:YabP/YqfC family sporulation protein [Anaerovorax odorimutans]MCQ4636318.1 YabP/YqfC family sporulation protein [Anaerovorax odorimutans]